MRKCPKSHILRKEVPKIYIIGIGAPFTQLDTHSTHACISVVVVQISSAILWSFNYTFTDNIKQIACIFNYMFIPNHDIYNQLT